MNSLQQQKACDAPRGEHAAEHKPSDFPVFAEIHVRVSQPPGYEFGHCYDGNETRSEYVGAVLDGFERTLKVTRHLKFLDFIEVWGVAVSNLAFLSLGFGMGAVAGMHIVQILA